MTVRVLYRRSDMVPAILKVCGREPLVFSRSSACFLSAVQAAWRRRVVGGGGLSKSKLFDCRRHLGQTTSLSTPGDSRAVPAFEAETDAGGSVPRKTDVQLEELTKLLDAGNMKLIDVREPREIEETGSIPTSANIPLTQLKAALQLNDGEFQHTFDFEKPRKDDASVVFYGLSSVKSAAAVEIAHKLGFKRARHYVGGWEEWSLNCRSPTG